jgi:hypothetical protein
MTRTLNSRRCRRSQNGHPVMSCRWSSAMTRCCCCRSGFFQNLSVNNLSCQPAPAKEKRKHRNKLQELSKDEVLCCCKHIFEVLSGGRDHASFSSQKPASAKGRQKPRNEPQELGEDEVLQGRPFCFRTFSAMLTLLFNTGATFSLLAVGSEPLGGS